MKLKVTNFLLSGFVLALVLLGGVAWLNWRHTARMEEAAKSMAGNHEVQANLNHLLSLLQDVETGGRGFVITDDPKFLEPFEAGVKEMKDQQDKTERLVTDPALKKHLAELSPLMTKKIKLAREGVELRKTAGFNTAKEKIAQGEGKIVMDQIRGHFAQMNQLEQSLMTDRDSASRREMRLARLITVAGIGVSFALLLSVFAVARREHRLREEAQEKMARTIEQLVKVNEEKEKAEAGLKKGRAVLENLFQSLPGCFMVLTPDLKIVEASDAYLKVTMTTRDWLVGRHLFDAFPDNPGDKNADGVANLRASLERVLKSGKADTMAIQKYDIRGEDGKFEERFWTPVNSPVFNADNQIEYIIHRAEDVTEFVRQKNPPAKNDAERQDKLEKMQTEIFQTSQALQAMNHQLQSANQELESFSYSVSHDLRAPLRHIHGYVEMLTRATEGQLSDKAKRYLTTISQASGEMSELIDDLLEFSRMGRTEMRERRVDLDQVVQETLRQLELALKNRTIAWKIAPLPAVMGDAPMLKQVFSNLIGNAVKYSRRRNQAEIAIGTAGEEEGRVIFFVRDNGAGFDMAYAGKLFGVFQRLHRSDEFEGTGIGLATVRRIVARHGGRTWAEGKLNEGATFYFTLRATSDIITS